MITRRDLVVAFVAITYATTGTGDSGARIFAALMACLSLIGLVVAPLGAFNALRNERMERTLDLVTVTTLSPLRIVIGKLTAQAVKLATLFAALAPFVGMSFLLGGIDFPTILYSLASLFLWSLWACAAALFLSCISKSRAVSALIFGAMILFLFFLLGASGMGVYMIRSFAPGPRGFGPGLGTPFTRGAGSLLWSFASMVLVCGVTMVNLILLAENRLLLPTEDRSTALRIGFFAQFLLIIGMAVYPALTRIAQDHPVVGRTIQAVFARGKHLLMTFSGDLILRTHLRMNGSWHIYPAGARWKRPARDMRVLVCTEDACAVGFNIPVAELLSTREVDRHRQLQLLGPDLLGERFDREEAVRRIRARGRDPIAEVLLDQRVIAGMGNVFKSEILFLAGLDPFTPVAALTDADLERIVDIALEQLAANVMDRSQTSCGQRPRD